MKFLGITCFVLALIATSSYTVDDLNDLQDDVLQDYNLQDQPQQENNLQKTRKAKPNRAIRRCQNLCKTDDLKARIIKYQDRSYCECYKRQLLRKSNQKKKTYKDDLNQGDGVYDGVEDDGVYDGVEDDGVYDGVEDDGVYDGVYDGVEDDGVYDGVYDGVEDDGVQGGDGYQDQYLKSRQKRLLKSKQCKEQCKGGFSRVSRQGLCQCFIKQLRTQGGDNDPREANLYDDGVNQEVVQDLENEPLQYQNP